MTNHNHRDESRSSMVALTWVMLFAGLVVFGGASVFFWSSGWWLLALIPITLTAIILYLLWGLLTGRYSAN